MKLNIQRTTILFVTVVLLLSLTAGAYSIDEAVPIGEYLTEIVPGSPDDMLYYTVTAPPIWRCDGFGERVESETFVFDISMESSDGLLEYHDIQLHSSLTGGYIDVSDIMAKADILLNFDVFMDMTLRGDTSISGRYEFQVTGYDSEGSAVETRVVESGILDNSDFNVETEEGYDEEFGEYYVTEYWSLAMNLQGEYVLPVDTEYINVLFYYNFDISGADNPSEDYWGNYVPGWGEFKTTTTPVKFSHALRHIKTEEEKEAEKDQALTSLAEKVQQFIDRMNGMDRPSADELITEPGTIVDIDTVDQVGDILRLFFNVGAFGSLMTSFSILSITLVAISFVLFGRKS